MLVRTVSFTPLLFLFGVLAVPAAGEPTPDSLSYFETKVRPLLVAHCTECHAGDDPKSELRLDSREGLLKGGAAGPALVPGQPEESLLLEAVRYGSYEMPPKGKLADTDVAILETWIAAGANWPDDLRLPVRRDEQVRTFTAEEKAYWAFQPVSRPAIPSVQKVDWCRNEIDYFILARLEAANITPAPPADRRTLVRRLSFDLVGLPPTPQQVESFCADDRPDAYERLVDELLANPAYGERWARHWLDLVRYAESDGFRKDDYRADAWRYRDYVIRSLNADVPYDRFIREQLAGDELYPKDPWALAATGLLRHGVYEYNQRDACTQRDDMYNEVTDMVGDVFLGLGFGCARCHDHKFDPLLQDDYYRLQAFFAGMVPRDRTPFATPEETARHLRQFAEWEQATAEIRRRIACIEAPHRQALIQDAVVRFPFDVQAMYAKSPLEQSSYEAQVTDLVWRQAEDSLVGLEKRIKEPELAELKQLRVQLQAYDLLKPPPLPTTRAVANCRGEIASTRIPKSEREIAPGYPEILRVVSPHLTAPQVTGTKARRTVLAQWLTRVDHPLTARVMANRVWQFHFGKGLVETASDFGRLGQPPSHPELLDWLACQFVDGGWSLKRLHRMIVCSATYQQSALGETPAVAATVDPQNRLLWRWRLRRVEAEVIHDSVLAITGELRQQMGGPSVDSSVPRRAIYAKQLRNSRDPLMAAFDAPEMISSSPERNATTTALQALLLANGPWFQQRAQKLSAELRADHAEPRQRIDALYQRLFSRSPTSEEREAALGFLEEQHRLLQSEDGWRQVANQSPIMGRLGRGFYFADDKARGQIGLEGSVLEGVDGFTIEAVVRLESLYEDASVRVIASQWDGSKEHPGWSLGVTSAKSAYKPRNLIVQLVGADRSGKHIYEVIPSDLFLELHCPYYISVAVNFAAEQPHVQFRIKRLDDPNAKPLDTQVTCQVTQGAVAASTIVLAGRPNQERHRWHGHVETLQLAARPVQPDEAGPFSLVTGVVGRWDFGSEDPLADVTSAGRRLRYLPSAGSAPEVAAWNDLCHVLLTSSELFYVD